MDPSTVSCLVSAILISVNFTCGKTSRKLFVWLDRRNTREVQCFDTRYKYPLRENASGCAMCLKLWIILLLIIRISHR